MVKRHSRDEISSRKPGHSRTFRSILLTIFAIQDSMHDDFTLKLFERFSFRFRSVFPQNEEVRETNYGEQEERLRRAQPFH